MATNGIGHNAALLTCSLPKDLKQQLNDITQRDGVSLSAFVRLLLEDAVNRDFRLRILRSTAQLGRKAMISEIEAVEWTADDGTRVSKTPSQIMRPRRKRPIKPVKRSDALHPGADPSPAATTDLAVTVWDQARS